MMCSMLVTLISFFLYLFSVVSPQTKGQMRELSFKIAPSTTIIPFPDTSVNEETGVPNKLRCALRCTLEGESGCVWFYYVKSEGRCVWGSELARDVKAEPGVVAGWNNDMFLPLINYTAVRTGNACWFDESQTDCASCHPGGCGCYMDRRHICVECTFDGSCYYWPN